MITNKLYPTRTRLSMGAWVKFPHEQVFALQKFLEWSQAPYKLISFCRA
jgi:hypothetical protein